jgi:hypothetical protein
MPAVKAVKPSPANRPTSAAQLVALLAQLPNQRHVYPSAAAACAAAHPFTTKGTAQQVRQQALRNLGIFVGRGGRHRVSAAQLVQGFNANPAAKASKAGAAKASKAAKASSKATPRKASSKGKAAKVAA